jgi:tetratricopeptide (TPR) repeat protein
MLFLVASFLALATLQAVEDPAAAAGFDHFYNLEYDAAITSFESEAKAHPQAPEPHNSIAQSLLYREMFRNGALESELVSGNNSFLRRAKVATSPEVEKRFLAEIERATSLAQSRLNQNPNDAGALYALGVANGIKANYDFLVRKAWRDALSEATTARKLHNRVTELEPANYDARLLQGVHDYIVGSLPWYYKSLGFLAGFHGDKELGIRTLEEVARKGRYNKGDAEIILCALYRREGKMRKALPLLSDVSARYPRNYLLKFEQAQMYSALGEYKNANATLDRVEELKRDKAKGYATLPLEKIQFERATIQFWHGDLEPALENFKRVTTTPAELDLNTGVLSYMRQGQIYDLTNRHALAIPQYEAAIKFAPQAEAAKESRRYISAPYKKP